MDRIEGARILPHVRNLVLHRLYSRIQHEILSEPAAGDISCSTMFISKSKTHRSPHNTKRDLLTKQEGTEKCGSEGQRGPLLRGGSDYITQSSEARTESGLIAARSAIPFFSWNDPAGVSESDR